MTKIQEDKIAELKEDNKAMAVTVKEFLTENVELRSTLRKSNDRVKKLESSVENLQGDLKSLTAYLNRSLGYIDHVNENLPVIERREGSQIIEIPRGPKVAPFMSAQTPPFNY